MRNAGEEKINIFDKTQRLKQNKTFEGVISVGIRERNNISCRAYIGNA